MVIWKMANGGGEEWVRGGVGWGWGGGRRVVVVFYNDPPHILQGIFGKVLQFSLFLCSFVSRFYKILIKNSPLPFL